MPHIRWLLIGLTATAAASGAAQKSDSALTLAQLEAKVQKDSLDAETHFRLAIRYWDLKRFDDVERELKTTVAIDPHYAPGLLSLAYLPYERRSKLWEEERKGKVPPDWRKFLDESYRLRRQAFLIDPMVDLRVAGTHAPPEDVVSVPDYGSYTTIYLWYLGLNAFGYTRYELAYSALDKYIERAYQNEPRDSIPDYLLWYRGLAAAHLRAYPVAVADFETLLGRGRSREQADTLIQVPLKTNDYRYVLAVLYQRWGKPADAQSLYQEAVTNDLGLYMAHVRLAQIYRDHQMWDQAIKEGQAAALANPDDADLLVELAKIQSAAGQSAAAESTFSNALERNPRDARIPYELGLVEQRDGKNAAARQHLTRFVAIAPSALATEVADAQRRLATLAQ